MIKSSLNLFPNDEGGGIVPKLESLQVAGWKIRLVRISRSAHQLWLLLMGNTSSLENSCHPFFKLSQCLEALRNGSIRRLLHTVRRTNAFHRIWQCVLNEHTVRTQIVNRRDMRRDRRRQLKLSGFRLSRPREGKHQIKFARLSENGLAPPVKLNKTTDQFGQVPIMLFRREKVLALAK